LVLKKPAAGKAPRLDHRGDKLHLQLSRCAALIDSNQPAMATATEKVAADKKALRAASELPIPSPALFTVSEVARVLRSSAATIYALCAHCELAATRVGNRLWIAPTDLASFLARTRRGRRR
jgi:excisionase family DNA binding protein